MVKAVSKWSLSKKQEMAGSSLRGFGVVKGTFWTLGNTGSILQIACEDEAKAKLTQAKYLSDIQVLPKVKASVVPNGTGKVFTVEAEDQGVLAALRFDKTVFILSAVSRPVFDKLLMECVAENGVNYGSTADVEVPMWLDRWDKYGFRFYYCYPGSIPAGKTVENYDTFSEFEFAEKSDHSGIVVFTSQNKVDTAEGSNNEQYWDWVEDAANQKKLPFALNLGKGAGSWLFNRYRDQTTMKSPQFCGNAYFGAASATIGAGGHMSCFASTGKDAELAVAQNVVREMTKMPNITTILEPHGELGHATELFMEYGPLADESYREYLKEKYKTISAVQKSWDVQSASWNDIHVPELAEFLGWSKDAFDLKGDWKVGYEKFSDGKTYPENELAHALMKKSIPTEKAPPEWFSEKFNDSAWPTVTAPGHDRTMFLPKRPAIYRRSFSLPPNWLAKGPKAWIYVWDLNGGPGNVVKVVLNGKVIGESTIQNNTPHWMALDATSALVGGDNQLSLYLPKGFLGYRIYLSHSEPKQYPDLGDGKNMQWVDFVGWSDEIHLSMVKRGMEMIRHVDKNRQIDVMAPGHFIDGIKQLTVKYGGNVKNTGYMGGFFADDLPSVMRGAGSPFSLEPGGPASDVKSFKKHMGLWATEGIQGLDYFIHIGSIFWKPDIKKEFEETLPMIRLFGKYHAPTAEVASLSCGLGVGITGYPWGQDLNTNLGSGYWQWNLRAYLMGLYESDILTESSFASGDAARYKVIFDSNTSIMDDDLLAQIEKYVSDGGMFVTYAQTGRHSLSKKNAWPISRLTGFDVIKIDRHTAKGEPAETHSIKPASNQKVFSGTWEAKANGLSLRKKADNAQSLMLWDDGSTAVGMRPIGKGFIIEVGCKFVGRKISDRIEGKPTPQQEALTRQLTQILQWANIAPIEGHLANATSDVVLRHYISNNDLYDVWTLWNRNDTQSATNAVSLPESVPVSWAWDVRAKQQVPVAGNAINFKLGPLERADLLTPRKQITDSSLAWFQLQSNWWRGTTAAPTKPLPNLIKNSFDLTEDWSFKPLQPMEDPSALVSGNASGGSSEKIPLGIWTVKHPNVKHALLQKTFTVPTEWKDGKAGLWIKLWDHATFKDKARAWLDGKLFQDWSEDGFTDVNPGDVLKPGTTHTLSLEIEGKGSLVGSSSGAWLWVWPKPMQILDLAGEWSSSPDALTYAGGVHLPGQRAAKMFRRVVKIPANLSPFNVVVDVNSDGGKGIEGVIINGFFVKHEISAQHFQVNVTPWVKFGEDNEIELVNYGNGKVNVRKVTLEFHNKEHYP